MSKLWDFIDFINWKEMSSKSIDIQKIRIMEKYSWEEVDEFDSQMTRLYKKLDAAIEVYTETNGKRPTRGGDDSTHDQVSQVIGEGRSRYQAVLKDPGLLIDAPYEENFFYVIPNQKSDYEQLNPEHYYNLAQTTLKELDDILTDGTKLIVTDPGLTSLEEEQILSQAQYNEALSYFGDEFKVTRLSDSIPHTSVIIFEELRVRFKNMMVGKFEAAVGDIDRKLYNRYYQFAGNISSAKYSNDLSDCKEFMLRRPWK